MILCFGIFAGILNCCRQKPLPGVKFVPRIAWVVDKMNSSLGSEVRSDVADGDLDGMEGNNAVVSRLLSCTRGFELSDKSLPSVEVAAERIKAKVLPFIDQDKIGEAVLAILYVISNDKTIQTERKETFRKYVGMYKDELTQQAKFDVPDFLARVLLYTTCVDNKEGILTVKEIIEFLNKNPDNADRFSGAEKIEKIVAAFIEQVAKESWVETKWDTVTQTVEIIPSEVSRIKDEIEMLSELRLSLLNERADVGYTDTSWLGEDEHVLFPGRYRRVELDSAKKAIIHNKMMQHAKLVHELIDCLATKQSSAAGPTVVWPIFPGEKVCNIRQQLETLSNELLALNIFSDRPDIGKAMEDHQ